ncbi:MAG: c-type cytochrome biogenesis protein CcsB [Calditerricola sp.]|nr:c-type cytochrome biogenesis protein CcsB [Calditerricola sp.]
MTTEGLIALSSALLLVAFVLYALSMVAFVVAITGKRWAGRDPRENARRMGRLGYAMAALGVAAQTGYIVTRWIAGGHIPVSNMFEFIVFLGFAIALAFLILYRIYRVPALGVFVMLLDVLMIAYGAVFPREVTPLIPALQSYWLYLHVTTAALGEGAFAVGFAAGLMYLVRTVRQDHPSAQARWLEVALWVVLAVLAFVALSFTFAALDKETVFRFPDPNAKPGEERMVETVYTLPSLVGPKDAEMVKVGYFKPLVEAPGWMKGKDAAKKLNTLVWSVLGGLAVYGVLRLWARRRLGAVLQPTLRDVEPELLDEISYRAIAIGFPIFTLGGLIFAMIWAHEAWGRFWGWDPKEVWALIVWLFYSAYLHLRLSRGWHGLRSAWLAVVGFIVVMITLVVVNLVIVGLHSYAGV